MNRIKELQELLTDAAECGDVDLIQQYADDLIEALNTENAEFYAKAKGESNE
jgi:hypothetical protein